MNTSQPKIEITSVQIAAIVEQEIPSLACDLRPDLHAALQAALLTERDERARAVLGQLLSNAAIASERRVPMCQDTGYVGLLLEVGPDVVVAGDIFANVDAAVARAYVACGLRKSLLADALLDRTNTGNNTPAFCELKVRESPGATLHIMLKGGGSDNASRVVMLAPGSGWAGVREVVLAAVREKAANACPPLVVGVGVGSTFDKVAGLAKHALLRPVVAAGETKASAKAGASVGAKANAELIELEAELLAAVNATGIGPGGFGGDTTALAVHIETAACHIAALPVAVNLGCTALRTASIDL